MKKKWIYVVLLILPMLLYMTGCIDTTTTVGNTTGEEKEDEISLTYTADFYDNFGGRWLSVEGKTFSISPNKIKTYSWNSNGSWISSYEMSSVMSIEIDGNKIESCGSTVIFADSGLEKCDIDFDTEISTEQSVDFTDNSSISQPSDMKIEDWFRIQYWWDQKSLNNSGHNARLVIIQSQLGDPICVYSGNDVSWDIPNNLPKTTMIKIDEKIIYIHRANFSIIDTSLLKK